MKELETSNTRQENNAKEENTDEKPQAVSYKGIGEVLDAHRGERHVIVLHNYPDPDAISTAYAHQLISKYYDIETDILYGGKISHQQNIALIHLLGIEPIHYRPDMDFSQYAGAVFVDNQGTSNEDIIDDLEEAEVPVLVVVDHHERQDRLSPEFQDIHRTGATATIYAGYLEDGLVKLDKAQKDHVLVATALMHGLLTDTNNFVRASAEDFRAAGFLSQYRDPDLLMQIMSQSRSRQTMEIIRQALGNRVLVENVSIAGVGYLRAEDRDSIPQAADLLITEENVHTAIVYGIVYGTDTEEKLSGSLRTSKITLDPDQFIKDVFGKDEEDHFYGGGKELAGGFEVPIGFLSGESSEEYRQNKWQVYDNQSKQKIFNYLGVDFEETNDG
jgi:nanoRNase/pAp phosphatase (c-di-AMP/oligoRNAs hydrolase)